MTVIQLSVSSVVSYLDSAEMLLTSFSCECPSSTSRLHRWSELSSKTVTRWPCI